MSSLLLFNPTIGEPGGNSPIPTIAGDGIHGDGGFSAADFMKEAANIDVPEVSYEGTSTDPAENTTGDVPVESQQPPAQPQPQPELQRPPQGQPARGQKAPLGSRKFDGLDEDEVPLFKQMSNEAYGRIYPEWLKRKEIIAENDNLRKELETANSKRYYEEDGAWNLHPEVKALTQNASDLELEKAFWEEQLANIEKGEKWYELTYKDGQYQYGRAQDPSPSSRAQAISKLTQVINGQGQIQSKLSSITSGYKQRYSGIDKAISDIDKELFGTLDLNLPHVKGPYEALLSKLPPELRGNKLAQMNVKSQVVIENLVKLLRSKEVSAASSAAARKVVLSQGPGPGTAGANGSSDTKSLDSAFARMTRQAMS